MSERKVEVHDTQPDSIDVTLDIKFSAEEGILIKATSPTDVSVTLHIPKDGDSRELDTLVEHIGEYLDTASAYLMDNIITNNNEENES